MIGPKKLRAIRQDLRRALAATGQDPIRWLDERLAASSPNGIAASGRNEVLQSLRRFLRAPGTTGDERKRAITKTGKQSAR